MTCLDDNAVAAYVGRALSDEENALVVDHLSTCDACLALTCAAGNERGPDDRAIGRYAILGVLGAGAMGTVYLAHDPQLDRKVALKVVRADQLDRPELQARLAKEARTMAQIRHENVVAVYDAGELDDGVYIAMELIEGESLATWLGREKRSWREVESAFAAAGRGLLAAHAAGVVHRDFKPENVLVEKSGRIAVTDFGVAGIEPGEGVAHGDISTTRTGMLMGTPRYMSPEQLRGEKVDARSDQFSFAVAMYEAAYGQRPFRGDTLAELSATVQAGAIAPPPDGATVPPRVRRVLQRALAVEPGRRFPSLGELLGALAPRRRTWPWLVAAAAIVAATTIAVWPHHAAAPPTTGREIAYVPPFVNDTGEPALDDTLDEIASLALHESPNFDGVAGPELAANGTDVEAIAAAKGGAYRILRGAVHRDGTGYFVELDGKRLQVATLDATIAAVEELARGIAGTSEMRPLSTSLPAVHAWVAGIRAAVAGDNQGAADAYQRALQLDPNFATARAALGNSLYNLDRKQEAIAELDRAFRDVYAIPERQRLTLLGDYYGVIGRPSESILAYQQLLAKWPGDGRAELNLTSTAIDANSWPLALSVAQGAAREHGQFEIARRNLLIAELGNERLADVLRDGGALLAEIAQPSDASIQTLGAAYALVGRGAEAQKLVGKYADASADLAAYEGRLDDAVALLAPRTTETEQLRLAWVQLRRGALPEAQQAARRAMGDVTMPGAYLAASAAVAAGDRDGLPEKVLEWRASPEADRRMYAELLAGDLAATPGEALAAYRAAARLSDGWIVHARLARVDADPVAQAKELDWCLAHRGQGALVATPSLTLLPELYLIKARAAHGDDARRAWQALSELSRSPQHDPWTDEARRALH